MSGCRSSVIITGDLVAGSGNFTTAHRIGTWLSRAGLDARIVHARDLPSVAVDNVVFVVGIHAIKGGLPCCSSPALRAKPLWILLSGTDMNEDVVRGGSERQSAIEFVCRKADTVVAVSPGVARRYAAFVASLSGRPSRAALAVGSDTLLCDRPLAPYRYIASAVDLLTEPSPQASALLREDDESTATTANMRRHLNLPAACKIALLVASIRAVKAPGYLLPAVLRCGPLAVEAAGAGCGKPPTTDGPSFAVVVVGPIMDADLRCKLASEGLPDAVCSCKGTKSGSYSIGTEAVAVYHPALPRAELLSWLRQADVALNTSESEGQSNAVLEAMSLGVPVAARNVEGNADLIVHGSTGLLFDSPEEGLSQCLHLCGLRDGGWPAAGELAARARTWALEAHSLDAEAAAWTELLRSHGYCEPPAP